jgi:hypothetical protein
MILEFFRYEKKNKKWYLFKNTFFVFFFVCMFDYWLLAAPLPPILAFAFAAALLQEAETGEFAPTL